MDKKTYPTFILGARIWRDGRFVPYSEVEINGETITAIHDEIPRGGSKLVYNGDGCYLMPGFVDMHVHFREPGYSYKETIATGSKAAANGGFTTVCTMPNLNPAPDTIENLRKQLDLIEKDALIDVLPYATITKLRMGNELVDYEALAPYVCGFSDDGSGVQDEDVMRRAMKGIAKTGKILAAHCEVNELLKGGYIHDGDYCRKHGHKGICSESEWKEVERDIRLAAETGCRLHVCHISTKESVALIREAKKAGLPVTCETGPHYLTFCDEDLREEGRFKMNPPIRSRADRDALIEGVVDGTIDVIATDHAPHSAAEKAKGLEKSAMGVVGLETAAAAVYTTLVKPGIIDMNRMAQLMSSTPRKILGLPDEDGIKVGMRADLTMFNPRVETVVDPETFATMGRATPYEGMTLDGYTSTFYKGVRIEK